MNEIIDSRDVFHDKKITIVVNTCDAYHDVLKIFLCALKEYWPDRKYNVVINTEDKIFELGSNNIAFHRCNNIGGKDLWGARLLETLKSITTEYIIMLYDDFILEEPVCDHKIKKIIKLMDEDRDIVVFYLMDIGLNPISTGAESEYSIISDGIDFRLNSAPAVWRRDDLINYTGIYDNPWAWEVFGSYRTFGDKKRFLSVANSDKNIYKYNYKKGGAIYRGKWVSEVVLPIIKKYNLDIDLTKRGVADLHRVEKRSLRWKLEFLYLGYRMVGFKFLLFLLGYIKRKSM